MNKEMQDKETCDKETRIRRYMDHEMLMKNKMQHEGMLYIDFTGYHLECS